MNRVRKVSDELYQVLITPHHRFDSNIEYLLIAWTDRNQRGFQVKEFNNLEDATVEAYKYPELDWSYLTSLQKSSYEILFKRIKHYLSEIDIVHDFIPKLLGPNEAKNFMFERILNKNDNFVLAYDMNDLISFTIVNPWSRNLKEIAFHLKQYSRLNLTREYNVNGVIHLIGETDVNTTYEIVLYPTLIYHWKKWANLQNNPTKQSLDGILKQQKILDQSIILR